MSDGGAGNIANESIIEGVTDFFLQCPLLKDGVFRVDALSSEPMEYAIEVGIYEPVIAQYVNGDSQRQFQFNFTSREYYSMDRIQNLENSAFYEQFAEWIETQDRAENYPEMPEGCDPFSLEILSPGYIFSSDARSARYQIQLALNYIKEGNYYA